MKVLVDTSIWIDHLHRTDGTLTQLLSTDAVYVAVPVLGELAAGNLPNRGRTLKDLRLMRRLVEAPAEDVLDWIEAHDLGGKGLSWVDCLLLATAEQNKAAIYSRDGVLVRVARSMNLAFAR